MTAPQGVAVNTAGDVFIGDVGNDRVRAVTTHLGVADNVETSGSGIKVFPNPSNYNCTLIVTAALGEKAYVTVTNVGGREICRFTTGTNQPVVMPTGWSPGVYMINATVAGKQFSAQLFIQN